jgi:hypothetical protein
MKTEIRINGNLEILLTPETPLESLVLLEMEQGAARGKVVTLAGAIEAPSIEKPYYKLSVAKN